LVWFTSPKFRRQLNLFWAFLLMDLTFYWWHLANHRIPFLWRFHNVHHVDPDLDVSTGFVSISEKSQCRPPSVWHK